MPDTTCPNEGTFLELVWGHRWTAATCEANQELGEWGEDVQPALIRFDAVCCRCSSRLDLVVTRTLALHKAAFNSSRDLDNAVYFRRAAATMRRTGIDEFLFGYGDETAGQCDVCGHLAASLDVGQARLCTVCWGFVKLWLNVVADPRAELVDSRTAQETQQQIKIAHQSGVIEAKLRTDPVLAREMKEADKVQRDGFPVDTGAFRDRLEAIELDLPLPVFYFVRGVSESHPSTS